MWLNTGNGTAGYQLNLMEYLMTKFRKDFVVLEVGSAYGGAVEMMTQVANHELGRENVSVYGYDTFEGHPKDLADDPNSMEAKVMDEWYTTEGCEKDKLSYDYQRKILDDLGLTNAHLVKGRVNKHSFDDIKKVHLAMLDMDLVKPTKVAYHALKDKIVSGGFMMFHDAYPPEHLPLLYDFVKNEVITDERWRLDEVSREGYFVALERK